jgi:hypothetical protein
MNRQNTLIGGSNAAHATTQNPDANLPDSLKTVKMAPGHREDGMFSIVRNKSSVATPLSHRELYCEKQNNPSTCGLHALRHFVGTQWISLDHLNRVMQSHPMWREALEAAYTDFVRALNASALQTFLQRAYPENPNLEWQARNRRSALEEIQRFAADMEVKKKANNWQGVLECMKNIRGLLTGHMPLPKAPDPLPDPLPAIDGYIGQMHNLVHMTDASKGDGTDPAIVRDALAAITPGVQLIEPDTLSLDKTKLDLQKVCNELDARRTDRAIVCGFGHFITLRKTVQDGWCIVDSMMTDAIPLGTPNRAKSLIEGKPFHGIILSDDANIVNTLASQLAYY